jgi:hypothetical protein
MRIVRDYSLEAQFSQKLSGANVHKGNNLLQAYRGAVHVAERQQSLKWYGFARECEREMRKCVAGAEFTLPAC